jgi:3-methylcrotonyl-CoA carboxylase alpha subunit
MLVGVNEARIDVRLSALSNDEFAAAIGSRREIVHIRQKDNVIFVQNPRGTCTMTAIPYLTYIRAATEISGELRAPLTGIVLKVNVARGDRIKMGDAAVVMESMKMELRIASKVDGIVTAVHFKPGDTVDRNALVAVVESGPAPQQPG